MSVLDQVDHLIRDLVPTFLDSAGLIPSAELMRRLPQIKTGRAAFMATKVLKQLNDITVNDPAWLPLVKEVSFWTEAALWMAVQNDKENCGACIVFLNRAIDSAIILRSNIH